MKTFSLLTVYLILVALLAATLGIAYLPLPGHLKIAAGLAVAVAKAALIVGYFMQLRDQRGLVRVFAGAGLFWLCLLFALTAGDYLTRNWG